jgi:hypothetical protein
MRSAPATLRSRFWAARPAVWSEVDGRGASAIRLREGVTLRSAIVT